MLDSQSAAFAERVWDVASQLGNNAPKIADDIMEAAFPLTCSQAREEGALRMLRTGIISEVKRILRKYGYPPDLEDAAVRGVLAQAEAMLSEIAA